MSDLSKDPVSLEDLKRAIEAVPEKPSAILGPEELLSDYQTAWVEYREAEADAWRTAFEWLASWERRVTLDAAYDEGMRLIREKLS